MSSASEPAAPGSAAFAAARLPYATDDRLDAILNRTDQEPVLLYYTATWCGPCKIFGPRLERYAQHRPDLTAYKVDGDESPQLCERFDVASYPFVVVVRHRVAQWTHGGDMPDDQLAATLDTVIASLRDARPVRGRHGQTVEVIYPATVRFPHLPTSRLAVRLTRGADPSHDSIQLGATEPREVTLHADDRLVLDAAADERRDLPLELAALPTLPAVAYDMVSVQARQMPADQLAHLGALAHVRSLWLLTPEPLGVDALSALSTVRANELRITAPGLDADHLATLMPGVRINGTTRSPAVSAALAPAARDGHGPRPIWTPPTRLAEAIATGAPVLAMIQAEHQDDCEPGTSWHTVAMAGELPDAHAVSAYGDDWLMRTLMPEPHRPALAVFRDGHLAWRADLPGDPAALRGLELPRILTGVKRPKQPLRPLRALEERVIRTDDAGADTVIGVELVPPGTVFPGARFLLTPGTDEPVPAGWTVCVRCQVWKEPRIPYQGLTAVGVQWLDVQIIHGHNQVDLSRLLELAHLESLTLDIGPLLDSAIDEILPQLRQLRRLRLTSASEAQQARARTVLPDTVINGSWRGSSGDPASEADQETA